MSSILSSEPPGWAIAKRVEEIRAECAECEPAAKRLCSGDQVDLSRFKIVNATRYKYFPL